MTEKDRGLVGGSFFVPEELDLSGIGLYVEKDPSVSDDDYFDSGYRSFGKILWQRKSDEGFKYHTYEDKDIKLFEVE